MSESDKVKSAITICPSCNGWGFLAAPEHSIHAGGERHDRTDVKIACRACEGKGVWLQSGNVRYFWLPDAGVAASAAEALELLYAVLVKIIAASFIILSYLEAINFSLSNPYGFYALVRQKGLIPFGFWLATALLIYSVYRLRPKSEAKGLAALRNGKFSRHRLGKRENLEVTERNIEEFMAPEIRGRMRKIIAGAQAGEKPVLVWHLLKVLFDDPKISFVLNRLEQDSGKIVQLIDKKIKELPPAAAGSGQISPEVKKAMIISFQYALESGKNSIDSADILISLALGFKDVEFFLEEAGIKSEDLPSAVWWARRKRSEGILSGLFPRFKKGRVKIKHRVMNRAWTARPTPTLDRFSYDITDFAAVGAIPPIADREREMREVMRILERNSKNNVLLVGEVGSGRKSIVRDLARLMARDDVLPKLKDKRLVSVDAPLLISGVKAGGELEERIGRILDEILAAGNIILFIPDIHNLAESGAEHGFDVSEILTPVFTKSNFQVIATTTFYDYHKTIERRSDFADTFDIVKIDEVTPEVALEILAREAPTIEEKEEVFFTFSALKKSIELSRRYIFNKLLPAKAIDLLSEAAVMARVARGRNAMVGSNDIMRLVTEKTGVPVTDITKIEADKLINLESEIHKRMVDQNEAVKVVAEAIKRMRVGLKNEKKPMGVFLFLGPTGVGKTELAKTLAEVYFGSEQVMVRLDMSEFQDSRSIDRLIGSGDGGINGILTEGVKKNPFSLVLLDEFEKSHPNVLDLFLQVFDDGRLTDGLGRAVDFTNTIIIATSNAGSKIIQSRLKEGKTLAEFKPEIEDYLLKYFKPELLNRFNAQVLFKTLSPEDILQIAKLQINNLARRLEKAQGIQLSVAPKAVDKIVSLGYSPFYGARNLQRTITEKLENTIVDKFLHGAIKRGQEFTVEDIE